MKRRVLAIVLAAATVSSAQGSLMYAATLSSTGRTSIPLPDHRLGVATQTVEYLTVDGAPFPGINDGLTQCLRGGDGFCFGYGTWNCCAELAALGAMAGAVGAWLAAGIAAYYYYYYC